LEGDQVWLDDDTDLGEICYGNSLTELLRT